MNVLETSLLACRGTGNEFLSLVGEGCRDSLKVIPYKVAVP